MALTLIARTCSAIGGGATARLLARMEAWACSREAAYCGCCVVSTHRTAYERVNPTHADRAGILSRQSTANGAVDQKHSH